MAKRSMQTRSGQALVMITLALVAMTGMMGLAVDLGWSFFVEKQAQAAADGAALAAVTRAYKSMSGGGRVTTAWSGCGSNNVDCQANPVGCDTISSGNLQSGCLYASSNGFTVGGLSGRQNVTIQANARSVALPNAIPTPPGPPVDMIYWVTVRTNQTVPQLFSALMGRPNGTVSAVATGAIASKILYGSFWGMNHKGDCTFNPSASPTGLVAGLNQNCGADINAGGNGGACSGASGNAFLCAPSGVVLASACNGATTGCSGYAGSGGPVYGGPGIQIYSGGGVNPSSISGWNPTPITSGSSSMLRDPLQGIPQPPISASASSGAMSACGYPNGNIPSTSSALGPMQYYSYTTVGSGASAVRVPNGKAISLPNNARFDPTATGAAGCPGGIFTSGTDQSSNAQFKTFLFYGGINANGAGTVTLGPGQYILAGTDGNNTVPGGGSGEYVLASKNTTFNDATSSVSSVGTMFVATDIKYPGLSSQMSNIPNWNYSSGGTVSKIDPSQINSATNENWLTQGTLDLKNTDLNLWGTNTANMGSSVPSMNAYDGILYWQDRRNSSVVYNKSGPTNACPLCTADDGTVKYCSDCGSAATNAQFNENNVTAMSPELSFQDGNGSAVLHGAVYQPRGAWFRIKPGTAQINNSPLQIYTGALVGGSGNTQVTLTTPTNPFKTYLPVLIQ